MLKFAVLLIFLLGNHFLNIFRWDKLFSSNLKQNGRKMEGSKSQEMAEGKEVTCLFLKQGQTNYLLIMSKKNSWKSIKFTFQSNFNDLKVSFRAFQSILLKTSINIFFSSIFSWLNRLNSILGICFLEEKEL